VLNAFLTILASNFQNFERFAIPCALDRRTSKPEGEEAMQQAEVPATVLMVEDEVLISHLVADWLGERGFAVHEVTTADEALRYIDEGGPVDVLFTDINLPGSMNGTELAVKVRERRPELPIVYASGRYSHSGAADLVPRSVFVGKPYDPADVCTLLQRMTAQ
jgi:DNA-binding NtrC family response regulator